MKRIFFTITALAIMAIGNLNAQNLQEVLQKHFEAIGQKNLLQKETVEINASINQMGMEFPMTMKIKRPTKFRTEAEIQGMKMVQVYDGQKGWMIAPWVSPEPQELTGMELNQAIGQANVDGELYNYAEKGSTASLVGKVNVEGSPMYNIKFTDSEGQVKNYFIDAGSFLIRKVKAKVSAQGQEMEVEQIFKDYKNIDGILMPGLIETITPMGSTQIVIGDVKFDQKFEDQIFAKP